MSLRLQLVIKITDLIHRRHTHKTNVSTVLYAYHIIIRQMFRPEANYHTLCI